MEIEMLVGLVSRWMHILAAITAVGGTIFARAVVLPAVRQLEPEQRLSLHAAMRVRWSRIIAAAILFLLASGLYNFFITISRFSLPRWYQGLFGVKFLAALAIFFIASLLSGKTTAAERFRQRLTFWMNLNIVLAVLVVCLSGVLRIAEKIPKNVPVVDEPQSSSVNEYR